MSTQQPDDERSQSDHEAIIGDSWLRAREFIRRAEAADIDPGRALWPLMRRKPPRYEIALKAHTATIQFRDDIRAYRRESGELDVGSLWNEEIQQLTVAGQQMSLSLATLSEWSNQRHEEVETEDHPTKGRMETVQAYRVLLPIAACRNVYRHTQDILHELGFTAPTDSPTPGDEASKEDVAHILRRRDQTQPMTQLPERFKNGGGDE